MEEYKFGTQHGWVQKLYTRGISEGDYLQAPHLKESQKKRLKRMLCSLQNQRGSMWRPVESQQTASSRSQKKSKTKTARVRSGRWNKKRPRKRESSSSETWTSSESSGSSSSDCEF
ncbi:ORF3 [Anelloviridae sp.]|nr:ORF3 [Anelloviridae sp.]